MWPVDEMGKNSVIPSTMARMIASTILMIIKLKAPKYSGRKLLIINY
jgi:hypothetical protein